MRIRKHCGRIRLRKIQRVLWHTRLSPRWPAVAVTPSIIGPTSLRFVNSSKQLLQGNVEPGLVRSGPDCCDGSTYSSQAFPVAAGEVAVNANVAFRWSSRFLNEHPRPNLNRVVLPCQ